MKNQYFGDNRDLFKYDLVCRLLNSGLVDQFLFIMMLTEDEQINRSQAKAGINNNSLISFLDGCIKKSSTNFSRLGSFLSKNGKVVMFDKPFFNEERADYFKKANELIKISPRALILVDPDIGLEAKTQKIDDKHVTLLELKSLCFQPQSLLMVFQWIPIFSRKDSHSYIESCTKKLEAVTGRQPEWITDNQIVFFFLTKQENVKNTLKINLASYKESYPELLLS
jgi:hypothetical protein